VRKNAYLYQDMKVARDSITRALRAMVCSCAIAMLVVCVASSRAYGDVGVVLNESLDTSVARITGSGHSAVYLSNICAESPVKMRLCRPGEQGSDARPSGTPSEARSVHCQKLGTTTVGEFPSCASLCTLTSRSISKCNKSN
jgi:hypothetical protein